MTQSQRVANTEVLCVLNKLNLINRVPNEIIYGMQLSRDKSWNFVYDDSVPLNQQRLTKQSAILFSYLYVKYICDDISLKQRIKATLEENERILQEETKYKLNNINLIEKNSKKSVINSNNDVQMVEIHKENIILRIISKIRSIFSKK